MVNLVPGGMGGTETYAAGLLGALEGFDELEVTALVPTRALEHGQLDAGRGGEGVTGGRGGAGVGHDGECTEARHAMT